MNESQLVFIILASVFCAIGIVLLLTIFFIKRHNDKKRERCVSVVKGEIVDIATGREGTAMTPIVKYEVHGLTYKKPSPIGSSSFKVAIGEEVDIYYDPSDPHVFWCEQFAKEFKFVYVLLGIMGTIFFVVGAGFVIALLTNDF